DGRQAGSGGELNDWFAIDAEHCIAKNDHAIDFRRRNDFECCGKLLRALGFGQYDVKFESRGCALRLRLGDERVTVIWVGQEGHSRHVGYKLAEYFQMLHGQFRIKQREPSQVTAWPPEALDQAKFHWVSAGRENNGNRCRQPSCSYG